MEYFIDVMRNKYAQFDGRARRKEYWMFTLFYILILLVVLGIDTAISASQIFYTIVSLAFFIPSLAVSIRRLHDTNRSGWWIMINLIPIIGFIVFLVFMCTEGTPGENQFGMNPKEVDDGVTSHLVEEDIV